jgi:hypothetical protein
MRIASRDDFSKSQHALKAVRENLRMTGILRDAK